jgi:phenylacetate-CoA ligase
MNPLSDALLTLRGIRTYSSFLKASQYLQVDAIRDQQGKWLSSILRNAHANVPWYSSAFRKYGVRVDSQDPFAELVKLPVLTKAEVRENHSDFCVPGVAARSLSFATSGTTGEPLKAYTSPDQWLIEQGVIWRQWKWAGYNFRDRVAIFRSYAPQPGQPLMKVDRLRNWAYFSVFRMDDAAISEYASFLQRWKPRFLRGYPSALMLVAQHALRFGWKLPGLKAAFCASEAVPADLRQALRDAFGIELFDHYGQAEITCMFHDCERHEGMHVDWEYGFVELLPSSEPGCFRIVATNLHNTAMPLLRYDTGDLAEGGWHSCSCGRGAQIVRAIRGRKDDYLIASDGSRMATVNLYTYFSKLQQIRRFQLVQNRPGQLTVSFTLWGEASQAEMGQLAQKIVAELSKTTGLDVRVASPAEFVQSGEGKFPTFLQRIAR